jgi:hypothetical protein
MRSWLLNMNNKNIKNGLIGSAILNNLSQDLIEFLRANYPNENINVSNKACLNHTGIYFLFKS